MKTFLIDDDHISLFLTEQMLKLEGLTNDISTFDSAEEALNTLLQAMPANVPEVILLDLEMPVMNGWDFLDALTPYFPKLKEKCHVYILTSSLEQSDTARSEEYDLVYGLLHKPIDKQDIQVIMSQIAEEAERKQKNK